MKFGAICKYKNKMELITKLIDIYIMVTPEAEKLIVREKEALAFYMIYGYNEESVKDIESGLSANINNGYVRTINNNLRNKGYLKKDSRNFKVNHLSPEMEAIKKNYLEEGEKFFVVAFKSK